MIKTKYFGEMPMDEDKIITPGDSGFEDERSLSLLKSE